MDSRTVGCGAFQDGTSLWLLLCVSSRVSAVDECAEILLPVAASPSAPLVRMRCLVGERAGRV